MRWTLTGRTVVDIFCLLKKENESAWKGFYIEAIDIKNRAWNESQFLICERRERKKERQEKKEKRKEKKALRILGWGRGDFKKHSS